MMSEKKNIIKEYDNGEMTVVWKPDLCIHSAICAKGLPDVFNPKARPWVNVAGAKTDQIIAQVKACPSGALTFYQNENKMQEEKKEITVCEVMKNGPLIVHATVTVKNADGTEAVKENKAAFCRCGASSNKPFCDGQHRKVGFEG
jgi:uncharacterized Fe-S cluster protein YjdI